jgi:hypothetical protein
MKSDPDLVVKTRVLAKWSGSGPYTVYKNADIAGMQRMINQLFLFGA